MLCGLEYAKTHGRNEAEVYVPETVKSAHKGDAVGASEAHAANWHAARVLPNIELETAIDGGFIALAPPSDSRVAQICAEHPNFQAFLEKFTGAFGEQLAPAAIIVHQDAPQTMTVEAIAGFRDAICASVAPYAHALDLVYSAQGRMRFSDHFEIYPWMLDKHYDDLLLFTPAATGIHDVEEFAGQPSAVVFHRPLNPSDLDDVLLTRLLKRWEERYVDTKDEWDTRALFRSLNMANQALLVPAGSETSLYDVGRSIAMWVAAFEILVHTGTGSVGWKDVVALIEATPWVSQKASTKSYTSGKPKDTASYTLASWLYLQLYNARNDFLHGNPVSGQTVQTPQGLNLVYFAAPLYRLALTSFLKLQFDVPAPTGGDGTELGKWMAERMDARDVQGQCERALFRAVEPKLPRGKAASFDPVDPDEEI